MSPSDRFTKKSTKRFKRLAKMVRKFDAPEGFIFVAGRVHGDKYPHVDVYAKPNLHIARIYFDGKVTKEWVHGELATIT